MCSLVARLAPLRLLCERTPASAERLRGYYALFTRVLQRVSPKTAACLHDHGIEPELFIVPWTLSLFTRALGLEVAVRLWDRIVLGGAPELLRCSVGVAVHLQPVLATSPFEEGMRALVSVPGKLRDEFTLLPLVDSVVLTEADLDALAALDRD